MFDGLVSKQVGLVVSGSCPFWTGSLFLLLDLLTQDLGFRQGIGIFELAIGMGPEGPVHLVEQGRISG